jgi:protease IV
MSDLQPQPEERGPPPQPQPSPAYAPPPAYAAPRPRPVRRGVPLGVWLLLAGVMVGGCALFMFTSMFAGIGGAVGGGQARLIEETIEGDGDAKVLLIELDGVIARVQPTNGLFGGGVDLVERFRKELEAAADDASVKAVLLSIDSPGGTVTASDQLWKLVQDFKRRTGRPVVVHMGALCASGGYYLAVAGDEIICEPTTITGSIGVILSGLNFHDLLQKYGVQDVTITSGPNKALLNPTSPRNPEHERILQGMVDEAYDRFTTLVQEGRKRTGLTIEEVRALADGRIYTAEQALKEKLVDQIGYRADALQRALTLSGNVKARLVRYVRPPTLADLLGGAARLRSAVDGPRVDLDALEELGTPRLMAIWRGTR